MSPILQPGASSGDPPIRGRLAILGMVVAAIVGLLIVRLWFLQVASGTQFALAATVNKTRVVQLPAQRGAIVDRNGTLLVTNKPSINVVVVPDEVRGDEGDAMLRRLDRVLGQTPGLSKARVERIINPPAGEPQSPFQEVVLRRKAGPKIVRYLAERGRDFPGVTLKQTYLRRYPERFYGAQLFGEVKPIFKEELRGYKARGYVGNEQVGKSGLEIRYEDYLRGTPGSRTEEIDAFGEPLRVLESVPARPGNTLKLTIDLDTQKALQDAIAEAIDRSGPGRAGAGVAMNPTTGEILGMASLPAPNAQIFVDGTTKQINRVLRAKPPALLNRAAEGRYPVGSTMKPITAIAALENGLMTPEEQLFCGSFLNVEGQRFTNFREIAFPPLDLKKAMEVSCDTYFYQLAQDFWTLDEKNTETKLQDWMRAFGLGQRTGIDVIENPGLVPDFKWREETFKDSLEASDKTWKPGDTVNLSIGQGDFVASPLQMAVAYAAIANGGTIVTPTVGKEIVDGTAKVVRDLTAARPSKPVAVRGKEVDPAFLDAVKEGLVLVTNGEQGTAKESFKNLPEGKKAAGKTGTAEPRKKGQEDHSWFVGYAPLDKPEIVVAIVIENGGEGGAFAAPAVCQTMSAYLGFDRRLCSPRTAGLVAPPPVVTEEGSG